MSTAVWLQQSVTLKRLPDSPKARTPPTRPVQARYPLIRRPHTEKIDQIKSNATAPAATAALNTQKSSHWGKYTQVWGDICPPSQHWDITGHTPHGTPVNAL